MADWLQTDLTPEYLKHPENVDQFVQQSFQMGQRAAEERARLAEEQRQFDVMAPLKQQDLQNRAKLQAIEIANGLRDQQDRIQMESGMQILENHVSRAAGRGILGEPDTLGGIYKILAQNPKLIWHPKLPMILNEVTAVQKATEADKKLQSSEDLKAAITGAQIEKQLQERTISGGARVESAQIGAGAKVQSAQISAQARVQAALERATQWGNHTKFEELKNGIQKIAQTAGITDEDYANRVEALEKRLAPSGLAPETVQPTVPRTPKVFNFVPGKGIQNP